MTIDNTNKFNVSNLKALKEGEVTLIGDSDYRINQKGIYKIDRKGQLTRLSMSLVTCLC